MVRKENIHETQLKLNSETDEDRSTNHFQAILSYYDDWNVPWTAQKSLTYLFFSYQSVWNACCLNIAPKGCGIRLKHIFLINLMVRKEYIHETQLKLNSETDMIFFNSPNARCIFIMTPFRLNQHSYYKMYEQIFKTLFFPEIGLNIPWMVDKYVFVLIRTVHE
jgi:hypothetical protein